MRFLVRRLVMCLIEPILEVSGAGRGRSRTGEELVDQALDVSAGLARQRSLAEIDRDPLRLGSKPLDVDAQHADAALRGQEQGLPIARGAEQRALERRGLVDALMRGAARATHVPRRIESARVRLSASIIAARFARTCGRGALVEDEISMLYALEGARRPSRRQRGGLLP